MPREIPTTQPSTALVPAAQNPTTMALKTQQPGVQLALVPVLIVSADQLEQYAKSLVQAQPSQLHNPTGTQKTRAAQAPNLPNIQFNSIIQINTNQAPTALNQGGGAGPQVRFPPVSQTTLPAGPTIENRPHAVENSLKVPSSTPANQQRRQIGRAHEMNKPPLSPVQNSPGQDKPKDPRTKAAPGKRPDTDQESPSNAQNQRKYLETQGVPVTRAQSQDDRDVSGRSFRSAIRTITKLGNNNHNHRVPSQKGDKVATPPITVDASDRKRSRPRRIDNVPAARVAGKPPRQTDRQTAVPLGDHDRTESSTHTARDRADLKPQDVTNPHQDRDETRGEVPGSTAVRNSTEGTGAGPGHPKVLKENDIRNHLLGLNSLLGKGKKKLGGKTVKLVLIGKASAEMMGLETTEKVYHIDVMLDMRLQKDHLDYIRQCMSGVFREFDALDQDTKNKTPKSFFGNKEQRAAVFDQVSRSGQCVTEHMEHLKVYVMDKKLALEFERRRCERLGDNDECARSAKSTSMNIIKALRTGPDPKYSGSLSDESCRKLST